MWKNSNVGHSCSQCWSFILPLINKKTEVIIDKNVFVVKRNKLIRKLSTEATVCASHQRFLNIKCFPCFFLDFILLCSSWPFYQSAPCTWQSTDFWLLEDFTQACFPQITLDSYWPVTVAQVYSVISVNFSIRLIWWHDWFTNGKSPHSHYAL